MRILAFRHAPGEDLGTIRPVLESRGIEVLCVDLYSGADMPDASTAAGLIFMGGLMCANDNVAFLQRERELIEAAAARGQPIFGVCLGAQLIARALGGTVYRNAVPETGWLDIHCSEAAPSDPIFSRIPPVQKVFHLHQDTFDLPPGATLLAGSALCANQAFRCGRAIYGVQFHPEMTPEMIADWRAELSLPELDAPREACSRLAALCETLLGGWSGLL
jgi:GMP synthase-like glutamine amidotransferase